MDEYPMVKEFHWRAQADMILKALLTDKPYPLKGAWIAGNNMLASAANPRKYYEALEPARIHRGGRPFHEPDVRGPGRHRPARGHDGRTGRHPGLVDPAECHAEGHRGPGLQSPTRRSVLSWPAASIPT